MAPCIVHRGLFAFDPDTVPSVLWDHRTGLSTELALHRYASAHRAIHRGDPCPAACENGRREIEDRAVREPICPECCKRINVKKRALGMPLLPEGDSTDPRWMGR